MSARLLARGSEGASGFRAAIARKRFERTVIWTIEKLWIDGFSGDIAAVNGGGTVAGEYASLASGTVFGTQSVSSADNNKFVDITLNADAIAFLNANSSSAFVVSNDSNTVLRLVTNPVSAVPEPRLALLLIPGVLSLIAANRRRSGC